MSITSFWLQQHAKLHSWSVVRKERKDSAQQTLSQTGQKLLMLTYLQSGGVVALTTGNSGGAGRLSAVCSASNRLESPGVTSATCGPRTTRHFDSSDLAASEEGFPVRQPSSA